MANYKKGIEYEIFINDYLNSLNDTCISYLWKNVPDKVLFDADLITDYNVHRLSRSDTENTLHDFGIDIVLITRDDKINFVQCKNYKRNIKVDDIAGFSLVMANRKHMDKLAYLYYTSNPSKNLIENKPDNFILCKKEFIKDDDVKQSVQYELYDYQRDAVALFDKYYEDREEDCYSDDIVDDDMDCSYDGLGIMPNNKAILSMPCGTGKTIMGCYISMKYDIVVLITPLKQYAEQNMDKYQLYDPTRVSLLIDSDGTRDIKVIKKFIKKNKRILLSVTYKSCDIINQLNLPNPFIIIDEFHNLSHANVYDENDELNKIINSDNKTLYMSATPRIYELEDNDDVDVESTFGTMVYKMDYNEAIERGYICDYEVILPVISESIDDIEETCVGINKELDSNFDNNDLVFQKCCYLFECIKRYGYMKCILYFRKTQEITEFIEMFNLMNEYHKYDYEIDKITYKDSKIIRNEKLNKFSSTDKMYFLCSVDILNEAIDIPQCDTIYITYECTSKVRCVQRMSRCLRKNEVGKIGRVMLWCDEISKCFSIVSAIKEIDVDFDKKVKMISINNGMNANMSRRDREIMKSNMKNVVGIKIYRGMMWDEMLERVKKFIDENKRRPSSESKNKEEKQLGSWIGHQQRNCKNRKQIMKLDEMYNKWKEFTNRYSPYFMSNEEHWKITLDNVKEFIDKYNKRPSTHSKNKEEKQMSSWIGGQQKNSKNRKEIMKLDKIYNEWIEFTNEYSQYFTTNEERWNTTLNNTEKFINKYNKRPSRKSKNKKETQLCRWIDTQQRNYKNRKKIMKIDEIYNKWIEFTNKYCQCLLSNDEQWNIMLDSVKKFIDMYNKRPSQYTKNKEEKQMSKWVGTQQNKSKNREYIMKSDEIYNKWIEFTKEYSQYFMSNEEQWVDTLNSVKEFMDIYNKRPVAHSKNKEEKQMGQWISTQQKNCKNRKQIMKSDEIYSKWVEFTDEFSQYFKTN